MRKSIPHVKTVVRGKVRYCYVNMGKVNGKTLYKAIGRLDAPDFPTRYAQGLAARTRRLSAPQEFITVADLIRLWQQSPAYTTLAEKTQRTYQIYAAKLERIFTDAPACEVERRHIYTIVDSMAAKPAAAKMLLLVARLVFRWGKKREHVPHDPTAGVESEHEATEYEPWPEHLIDLALQDAHVRLPVALLYFTGQRIGDITKLRWSDVRHGIVHVVQQKTGKELEIPVHSELAKILAETPKKAITIITSAKGAPANVQTVRAWLKDFGKERGVKLLPHGLRKNAVNALLEVGCATGEVSSITGQSLRIVEHYAKRRNNPRMAKAAILKWERKG